MSASSSESVREMNYENLEFVFQNLKNKDNEYIHPYSFYLLSEYGEDLSNFKNKKAYFHQSKSGINMVNNNIYLEQSDGKYINITKQLLVNNNISDSTNLKKKELRLYFTARAEIFKRPENDIYKKYSEEQKNNFEKIIKDYVKYIDDEVPKNKYRNVYINELFEVDVLDKFNIKANKGPTQKEEAIPYAEMIRAKKGEREKTKTGEYIDENSDKDKDEIIVEGERVSPPLPGTSASLQSSLTDIPENFPDDSKAVITTEPDQEKERSGEEEKSDEGAKSRISSDPKTATLNSIATTRDTDSIIDIDGTTLPPDPYEEDVIYDQEYIQDTFIEQKILYKNPVFPLPLKIFLGSSFYPNFNEKVWSSFEGFDMNNPANKAMMSLHCQRIFDKYQVELFLTKLPYNQNSPSDLLFKQFHEIVQIYLSYRNPEPFLFGNHKQFYEMNQALLADNPFSALVPNWKKEKELKQWGKDISSKDMKTSKQNPNPEIDKVNEEVDLIDQNFLGDIPRFLNLTEEDFKDPIEDALSRGNTLYNGKIVKIPFREQRFQKGSGGVGSLDTWNLPIDKDQVEKANLSGSLDIQGNPMVKQEISIPPVDSQYVIEDPNNLTNQNLINKVDDHNSNQDTLFDDVYL
ncbi:MAG: hypothetical protein KFKLKKLM_02634 [Flavobacteriales bacterium]|nr:hypothetical protein [Flavobacteriales bacterium]